MRRSASTKRPVGRFAGESFPQLPLPLPMPYPLMESRRADDLPDGDGWQFEPKWDGFRCLVFRAGQRMVMQSKAGQSLSRYFPELTNAFLRLPSDSFVLDGEIVILKEGSLSFDDLLMRIHPAKSRVAKLAKETPASFMAFDLLYEPAHGGRLLVDRPLKERRVRLEQFFKNIRKTTSIHITPVTLDRTVATKWFSQLAAFGCDGVMAKLVRERYHAGDRDAMIKVKHRKTADWVVGGFRVAESKAMKGIGSLLLGLYDKTGILHHVGHASSFSSDERLQITRRVGPMKGGAGFSGRAPGGPSRWSTRRSEEWERVDPVLVCEVAYDYFSEDRFRHGTKFLRWRPEKDPKSCDFDQIRGARKHASWSTVFSPG